MQQTTQPGAGDSDPSMAALGILADPTTIATPAVVSTYCAYSGKLKKKAQCDELRARAAI